MTDKKISQLSASAALTGTEQVPVVQSGQTVRTTTQDIAALSTGAPSAPQYSVQFNNPLGSFDGDADLTWTPGEGLLSQQKVGWGVTDVADLSGSRETNIPTVPVVGDEIITNGTFTGGAAEWTFGADWTYGSNQMTHTTPADSSVLEQPIAIDNFTDYQVQMTVSGMTTGRVLIAIDFSPSDDLIITEDGTYTVIQNSGNGSSNILIEPNDGFDGSVDNVSVKQYTRPGSKMFLHLDGTEALKIETDLGPPDENQPFRIKTTNAGTLEFYAKYPRRNFPSFKIDSAGVIFFQDLAGGVSAAFSVTNLTEDREYTFPDADGTFFTDASPTTPLASYAVSSLPIASQTPGQMIYINDETGGPVPAFSDGTNWRRVTDRAIAS